MKKLRLCGLERLLAGPGRLRHPRAKLAYPMTTKAAIEPRTGDFRAQILPRQGEKIVESCFQGLAKFDGHSFLRFMHRRLQTVRRVRAIERLRHMRTVIGHTMAAGQRREGLPTCGHFGSYRWRGPRLFV